MKKLRALVIGILSIAIVAGIVYAAVPNGPQPSVGIVWYTSSDPTMGGGVVAPLAQFLVRQDVPSIYFKSGSANTAWTKIGSGAASGGTVTSITCGTGLTCTATNPITTAGTITANLTGTGTNTDLTAWTGANTIGNYAGSSCGASSVTLSAAGALGCATLAPASAIAGTTNTMAKFASASTVGNSSVTDNTITVMTAEAVNVGAFTDIGQLSISGSIAPASFTGTRVDDYNPTGLATTYVIDQVVTSATTITGLTAQVSGTQIDFRNSSTSTGNLTFSTGDANSLAANRFAMPGAVNWIVPPGSSVLFRYTGNDWRVIATSTTDLPILTVDGNAAVGGTLTADSGNRVLDACGTGLTCSTNTVSLTAPSTNTYTATASVYFDDYLGTPLNASAYGAAGYSVSNNATAATFVSVPATGRPGIAQFQTGTVLTGNNEIETSLTAFDFGSYSSISFTWTGGFETLSNGTQTYAFTQGFCDAANGSINCTDGCGWLYDEGNVATGGANPGNANTWQVFCANNSARTFYLLNGSGNCDASFPKGTVNVAALVLPNTNIQTLETIVTGAGTEADFYANGVKVCEITTNIPTTSARATGAQQHLLKSLGTVASTVDVDATTLAFTLSSARSP